MDVWQGPKYVYDINTTLFSFSIFEWKSEASLESSKTCTVELFYKNS